MSVPASPAGPAPSPASAGNPEHTPPREDENGRIGIFPSWKALYIAVIVYTAGLIAVLRVFTVMLDTSAR